MFKDENGKVSSTRITLYVMLAAFVSLVGNEITAPDQVWSIIQSVMLLCLGGTAIRSTVKNGV